MRCAVWEKEFRKKRLTANIGRDKENRHRRYRKTRNICYGTFFLKYRGSLIEGRFFIPCGINQFRPDILKTSAYVEENRKLDARFCVTGFQEFVETNASAPTVQLQSIRLVLSVISYRRWHFGRWMFRWHC